MQTLRKYYTTFVAYIDRGMGRRNFGYILLLLLLAFFIIFPFTATNYAKGIFISGFFFAILASSWALLAGVAGQFSFGHMAFMGIGAYTSGLIGVYGVNLAAIGLNIPPESISPVVAIAIGTVMSGLVGLLIGALCLRLRAAYLALFTIAFSELFRIVMLTEFNVTGGNNGLRMRRLIDLGSIDATRNANYFIMFGVLLASLGIMYALTNSRVGLFLRAMREDDEAASALGVNVVRYKVFVFVITSMIVGLAGGLFYHNVGAERITPESMEVLQMALVIAYAIIGGMESLFGAAVGAFLSRYILEAIREITLPFGLGVIEPGAWRFALFGLVLMFTLRFARNGLISPILRWFDNESAARQETVAFRNAASETPDATAEDPPAPTTETTETPA